MVAVGELQAQHAESENIIGADTVGLHPALSHVHAADGTAVHFPAPG